MAKQKHKWSKEEEEALSAGVERYGHGKWKVILSDPQFSPSLAHRSNIDLKDKWRNMNVSGSGSSSRDRIRTPTPIITETVTENPPSTALLLRYDDSAEPSRRPRDRIKTPTPIITDAVTENRPSAAPLLLRHGDSAEPSRRPSFRSKNRDKIKTTTPIITQTVTENPPSVAPLLRHDDSAEPSRRPSSRSRSRNKIKSPTPIITETVTENPPSATPLLRYDDSAEPSRRPSSPRWKTMILDALSTIEDPYGPDLTAICNFIQSKYELPENFTRFVKSKLRRLILTGEVEKVGERFKLKGPSCEAETEGVPTETAEDAARVAARAVAIAENFYQQAIEACEEDDKIAEMLEESAVMLKLAEDLHQMCMEKGMVVLKP